MSLVNVSWFLVSFNSLVPSLDVQSSSVAQSACRASVSSERWVQTHTPWAMSMWSVGRAKGGGRKRERLYLALHWNAGSVGGGAQSRSRTSFLHPAGHTCPVNPLPHPKDADRPSKNKYPNSPTELYLWMPSKCEGSCWRSYFGESDDTRPYCKLKWSLMMLIRHYK